MKVAIAGGGLAGLSCAVELVDAGVEVTVLEADSVLGGKATSWTDEDGDTIETGLHVIPRRYETLLGLVERVGATRNLLWCEPDYTYVAPGGRVGQVRMAKLPTPLHVIVGMLRYEHLGWRDRASGYAAIAATVLARKRSRERLDEVTISEWLRRRGATRRFIDNTLDPAARAFTFLDADHVSAKSMYYWLRHFVKGADAARVAVVDGGMGSGLIGPIADHLEARGAELRRGARVGEIGLADGSVTGLGLEEGATIRADAYVSALPVHELRELLPKAVREDRFFADLANFTPVPVISVQIWFDRKLTEVAGMMMFTEGPVSVFSDLSNLRTDLGSLRGSMMELVISPAQDSIGLPDEQIVEKVLGQLREAFPAAREAEVTKSAVVRIPQSIYAAIPGMDRHRPPPGTPLGNLFIAGDYARCELPPSMEAATVSGQSAARALLDTR
jgi:squalene-associated FAD-dependent desaturase